MRRSLSKNVLELAILMHEFNLINSLIFLFQYITFIDYLWNKIFKHEETLCPIREKIMAKNVKCMT